MLIQDSDVHVRPAI